VRYGWNRPYRLRAKGYASPPLIHAPRSENHPRESGGGLLYYACMRFYIRTFLVGTSVLLSAILLNAASSALGIITWYDILRTPQDVSLLLIIWLCVLYPLSLGLVAHASGALWDAYTQK
jgi:hypothetical protein